MKVNLIFKYQRHKFILKAKSGLLAFCYINQKETHVTTTRFGGGGPEEHKGIQSSPPCHGDQSEHDRSFPIRTGVLINVLAKS